MDPKASAIDKIYDDPIYDDVHQKSPPKDAHHGAGGEALEIREPEELNTAGLVSVAGCAPGVACGHMTVAEARVIRGYSCVAFVTGLIGLIVGLAVGLQQRKVTTLPSVVAIFNLGLNIPTGPTAFVLAALISTAPFNALRSNVATIAGVSPSAVFLTAVSDGATGEVIRQYARNEAPNSNAARRLGDKSGEVSRELATSISLLSLSIQVEGTVNNVAQASVGLTSTSPSILNAAFKLFLDALSTEVGSSVSNFTIVTSVGVYVMSPSATPPAFVSITPTGTDSTSNTNTGTATQSSTSTSTATSSSSATASATASSDASSSHSSSLTVTASVSASPSTAASQSVVASSSSSFSLSESSSASPSFFGIQEYITGNILLSRVETPNATSRNALSRVL